MDANDNNEDLERRLAAARERKRAAEAKRQATQAAADALAKVETEEREALDEEAIANAEAEHGANKIGIVRTDLGAVIVKRPHPAHYKRFRDRESAKTQDLEKLVRPCVVYPDATRFDAMLDEQPAILDRVANQVVELAGFRAREVSGK